jgi:hypothetical protein
MLVRRTSLLLLLALWQGGFMFYGAIVVPVGARVLESETEQGFITQQVTVWLNGCGLAALVGWLWVLLVDGGPSRSLKKPLLLWGGLLVTLLLLVIVHGRMDRLLDIEGHSVVNPIAFYTHHRVYLILSTLQWLGSIALLVLTLQMWARADQSSC